MHKELTAHIEINKEHEEKCIGEKWLEIVKMCQGKPVVLEGKFSYEQRGNCGKYCFTHIRPFIVGKYHRKEYGVITKKLIINVAGDTINLLKKANEEQVRGPKGRVYLIGYPTVYLTDDGRQCGFNLAYNLTKYPVRIKNGTWKIEQELYCQCCQLDPQKFLKYGEDEEKRDIKSLYNITKYSGGKPVIFLTKFAFNNSEDRRFIFKNARIFKPNEDPHNSKVCIKKLKVEAPYWQISTLCHRDSKLLNGQRWYYIIGYPDIYMYKNKHRCGFRLAFDVTSKPVGAYTGQESIPSDVIKWCYIADSSKYCK